MSYEVVIAETEHVLLVEPDQPILDAALRANILLPHDCRSGGCGSCRIRITKGDVVYPDGEMPMGIDEAEVAAGYALACQARPVSPLVIEAPEGLIAAQAPRNFAGSVAALREVAGGIFYLAVELETAPVFLPGQYAGISCGDRIGRNFSMASVPRGKLVDFYIRKLPNGHFTDHGLSTLHQGARLDLELPLGGFRLHAEDYRPLVMIATGTGIAPIKAMLESLLDNPLCPPVSLYWGMRTQDDLFLDSEIRGWEGRLYDFNYVPVLSRPERDWSGRTGHVQEAVAADFPDLSEHAVYLCGSPEMVRDAKRVMAGCGAEVDHIHAEGFTLQGDEG